MCESSQEGRCVILWRIQETSLQDILHDDYKFTMHSSGNVLSKDDVIEKLDSIREGILNGEDAKPLAGALSAIIWDLQGMVEWEDVLED